MQRTLATLALLACSLAATAGAPPVPHHPTGATVDCAAPKAAKPQATRDRPAEAPRTEPKVDYERDLWRQFAAS